MTDTLEQRARGLLASEFPLADGFSAVLVRDMSIPQLGVVDTAIALRAIVAALQAQQPGAQEVGYIDEGDDGSGMFAEFYPDRDLRVGAKLYTQPPSIPEPTAEHWRRAIEERGIENPKALDWIEQRARQMAKAGGDRG